MPYPSEIFVDAVKAGWVAGGVAGAQVDKSISNSQYFCGRLSSYTSSQGAYLEREHGDILTPGTWDLDIFCPINALGGTTEVALDGVSLGSYSQYNASSSRTLVTISGIAISETSRYLLRFTNIAGGAGVAYVFISGYTWRKQ